MQLINLTKFGSIRQTQAIDSVDTGNNGNWISLTRNQCAQRLHNQQLDYINFAHWLAIPSLNLMLVFKNGICCQIEQNIMS